MSLKSFGFFFAISTGWAVFAEAESNKACAHVLSADEYNTLSFGEKLDRLWRLVLSDKYSARPSLGSPSGPAISQIFNRESLSRAITDSGDVLSVGRTKIIHNLGATAKVTWIATPPSENDPIRPRYTGLFATGGEGLLRYSAALPKKEGSAFVPGLAIKFPISGKESLNLFVMENLEGQGQIVDPFYATFTQVLPDPKSVATIVGTFGFERVVKNAIAQDLSDLASVNQNGSPFDGPAEAPEQIWLVPTEAARAHSRSMLGSSHFSQSDGESLDFRDILGELPPGTTVYEVWARVGDSDAAVKIAEVKTESAFESTPFQDLRLFFKHNGFFLKEGIEHWLTLPRLGGVFGSIEDGFVPGRK